MGEFIPGDPYGHSADELVLFIGNKKPDDTFYPKEDKKQGNKPGGSFIGQPTW